MQRVVHAPHSLSLGEERVYETLWNGRESDGVYPENPKSKTFSLGYDRIARLVRLNEKSVRMLLPKLLFKKPLEVVAAENSASRIGRTYRIFSYEEILNRQRASNLTHVAKNGRAVEFVWAVTASVGETTTEEVRALVSRFDDHTLRALWASCIHHAPDCTLEEVEYCLRLKAQQLLATGKPVIDPVGLMLRAVPKCFEGSAALHLAYRQQKRAGDELRRQAAEELSRPFPEPEPGREGKSGRF